jgi:PAS domain S-box-containing protein
MTSYVPSIVLVDDAAEVRLLIRTRLRLSGGLAVLGEGADGAEAVALAAEHQPDLMLLDVSMPGMDGLAALPRVLEASPGTQVVLYSGFEEHGLAERGAELGAAAFIEKSTPVDSLIDRLLAVHAQAGAAPESGTPAVAGQPRHVAEPSSDRVGDQAVLDEHLERFREVFDEAAIGMATMTLAGTVVRANRALAALTGLPTERLVGSFYGDVTDGRAADVAAALGEVREHPVNVLQLEHGVSGASDGRVLQATLAPVRDSGGRPLYLFLQVQDVTEERRALEELRRSEQRFRLLVEAVQDYAIFMLSPEGIIVSWNAGAQRSKGYTAEEIIGQHFRVFYPPELQAAKHPEHELELAVQNGHYEEEGWRVRKDGSTFWALVLITAVFDEDGEHIGFAKVTRDTTERRRLEQRLQRAVEEQEQFLAVTAHELRTPIGVLGGAAQTLADHWAELTDEERAELLDAMSSSTSRLRRLLADLLTASRLQSSALEFEQGAVPVHGFLVDAVSHARRTAPDVDIRLDCPDDLADLGDRDRLAQMMDNLIGNALRHGVPPVHVAVTADDEQVTIRVRDEGTGVSDAIAPRLFDRFATGMRRGGTGLGLFIVRELARAQGGDAFYEAGTPEAPAGSFVLTLPRAR